MEQSADFDIAIIGSGIAGSALSLALNDSPYKVALIDPAPPAEAAPALDFGICGFDPRVFAMNLASINFLKQLGVWDTVTNLRHQAFSHMFVVDGEGTGKVHFSSSEINRHYLGSIVEHKVLLYALQHKLQASNNMTLLNNAKVDSILPEQDTSSDSRITLSDGRSFKASLIVGADGGNSLVRKSCSFKTREWSYGHTAIVCTVALEKSHNLTAWQRFMHSGPLAFLPLPSHSGQSFASIVWSVNTDEAKKLMALSDTDFKNTLFKVSENWFGAIQGVSKRFCFDLHQSHVIDYVKPGIALVADAAHTIHPLAGQGINLGLQDVSVLAEELLNAVKEGKAPGNIHVLSRYQRRRKADNLAMMAAMDTFKRLFQQPSLGFSLLRRLGMSGVMHVPLLRQKIIRHAAGMR